MVSTFVATPQAAAGALPRCFDADANAVPAWRFDVLAGAGAIVSTARDLAAFAGAALNYTLAKTREVFCSYRGAMGAKP